MAKRKYRCFSFPAFLVAGASSPDVFTEVMIRGFSARLYEEGKGGWKSRLFVISMQRPDKSAPSKIVSLTFKLTTDAPGVKNGVYTMLFDMAKGVSIGEFPEEMFEK